MEKVFINHAYPCNAASVSENLERLRTLLSQAAAQATGTGKAVLASLVLPVPASDPLRVFRALHTLYPGACSYWEQPAHQAALVGAGAALSIQTSGTRYFADAALAWRQLRDTAVVLYTSDSPQNQASPLHGPALFGGFSFDPLRARTPLWRDFPDGLLSLPRLLFRQYADQATLTLSCLVQATDTLDNLTHALQQEATQFLALLDILPGIPEDEPAVSRSYKLRDVWPAPAWKKLVSQATHLIQQGAYAKVVMAREVEVTASPEQPPFSLITTLQRLRKNYPAAYVFAFQHGKRAFVGATPERLVHAQDGQLHTMALAGSAPRGATEAEDLRLGSALLASQKNREEHEIVTTMLRTSLTHLCSKTWIADTPEILRLKNIQHLQTAIVGELLPDRNLLDALHTLHPTPAVGGTPTEAALAFIREHEYLDRGWYAGPVGWIDLQGNGEFAVALRSALLEPRRATLFAGCGIVKDSNPEAEYLESCLKLQVILRSLSGEE
jgi:isochorismate synthase